MELSWILAQQVLVMFLLMGAGFFCCKKKIIYGEGGRQLSNVLLMVILPCLIVNVYQVDYDPSIGKGLLLAFGLAAFTHIFFTVAAKLCFPKREDARYRVERFATVYSNAGFMGLPLIQATMGDEGVIFATAYVAVLNFFVFTLGEMELKGERRTPSIKKILLHPGVWSVGVALILYFLQIRLPMPIGPAVNYIASMNTPLAMISCGVFLAEANVKGLWKNRGLYRVLLLRLILLPMALILLYRLIHVRGWFDMAQQVVLISLISASCPTAALASIMSRKFDQDASYGGQLVAVTTFCSIFTLPLMIMVAQLM